MSERFPRPSAAPERRPKAALAMTPDMPARLFGPDAHGRLAEVVDVVAEIPEGEVAGLAGRLGEVEILVACWGAPLLDAAALESLPRLRAVVYAAGSVRGVMTPQAYERGITISSAASLNAIPVAEYTLASILLAGKRVFAIDAEHRRTRDYRPPSTREPRWGNFGLRVGIVSASRIGRRVIDLLRPFDVEILAWDPIADGEAIAGVTWTTLDDLLRRSDVVSLHAPALPETERLIGRRELALLPDGATLINTARASLVDQDALLDELYDERISAVIDVTDPEPLPPDHPLFSAPNLVLTPHIAGSQGNELLRLGDTALAEAARYAAGEPFAHDIPERAGALLA